MYSVNLMGHIEKCVFDLGLKATEKNIVCSKL